MTLPVLTLEEMRAWEARTWAQGIQESHVIERVGAKIGQRLKSLTRRGDRIVLLAGKGHNGDDVRAAVKGIKAMGREGIYLDCVQPDLARVQFREAIKQKPVWIVDGLFGIGINRPLDQDWVDFIDDINHADVPVFAIDIPSGLNAQTGQPMPKAVRAHITFTIGAVKAGLIQSSAWEWTGKVEVATDIGLFDKPDVVAEILVDEDEDRAGFLQVREVHTHKGNFGHVGILAGSRGYHGAAVLCAQAASRAQPGLVSLFTSKEVIHPVASSLSFAMVHEWCPGRIHNLKVSCLVIGPGLADPELDPAWRTEIVELWDALPLPVIVDASALDWLPSDRVPKYPGLRVITPHPGEAARILRTSTNDIQSHRTKALRQLSEKWGGIWVVLKGYQTQIGRSSGPVYLNLTGNPSLAQGGSGDILAGFMGGMLANPYYLERIEKTLSFCVWKHGEAADRLSRKRRNWNAEDLESELNRS